MGLLCINDVPAKVEQGPTRDRVITQAVDCVWDGKPIGQVIIDGFKQMPENYIDVIVSTSFPSQGAQVFLHWGVTTSGATKWQVAPEGIWPANTVKKSEEAAQTQLTPTVTIRVPADSPVRSIRFCVKRQLGSLEQWFSNGGGDFVATIKADGVEDVGKRVVESEGGPGGQIFPRFALLLDLLGGAQTEVQVMAWIYTVARLHHIRVVKWYGGWNYQPRDLAHLEDQVSKRTSYVAVFSSNPHCRRLARMMVPYLSRGGGKAEAIRLEILDIMRRHGIKEGHRPGIDDKFLEQWHQKLHQNSSIDDVYIGEAYLHFLHTGHQGDFWKHLWDNHQISREYLAGLPNPIKNDPKHLPQLINDMKHYLWTVRSVHGGADIGFATEMAKWALEKAGDNEAVGWLYDIMRNAHEWWIPGKLAATRHRLVGPMRSVFAGERDLLLLDASLEGFFKTAVERTDMSSLNGDSLIDMIDLVLDQSVLSRPGLDEWSGCLNLWRRAVKDCPRWNQFWARQSLAACEKIGLMLGAEAQWLHDLLQDKAEQLGEAAKANKAYIINFTEEVVRAQPSFLLSLLLYRLVPMLRTAANVSPWTIVSSASSVASGTAVLVSKLSDLITAPLNPPVADPVVFANAVDGNDDIPAGVVALVTPTAIDVLSHLAIRARNQHVLLATADQASYDAAAAVAKAAPSSSKVRVTVRANGDVEVTVATADAAPKTNGVATAKMNGKTPSADDTVAKLAKLNIGDADPWSKYVVLPAEATAACVGAKSLHIAKLAKAGIAVPESLTLPFRSFEKVLEAPVNAAVAQAVKEGIAKASKLAAAGKATEALPVLAEVRQAVEEDLSSDVDLDAALHDILKHFGLPTANSHVQVLFRAVKHVWASKWTDRAFLSRAAHGIPDAPIFMAVLIQPIVTPKYAFVLHTANPITRSPDEVFGQLVQGMGEALVGNAPGRAFTFTSDKAGSCIDVLNFGSKRVAYFVDDSKSANAKGGLMVRSDSNGEDLEDFAGAGLYESVACLTGMDEKVVDWSGDKLWFDGGFRDYMLKKLVEVAVDVERKMGGKAQDIEGVVRLDDSIVIVQTRPQLL
mmetsp:Transcript_10005/g.17421  ORF Transcript_10005/g.17421 Transcript_10005/m.17421 type:complete len:1079 (-) Transcript_10005:964-4200(-)|eukprot:CAMPEP_0196659914 /NCGR_PEP_ID=MMETSP1086-20130531/37094_1 /TAXON_ID=77921 /ORGANISM="Cyanoptyche  gloeocystis , Strain SAG4.97" /LENGTH=1078 /DNA_ID=CAMNT_0041994063 /DNA_START=117 /DNA_END=3353 /DNA_ORIENTATION=+